MRTEKEIRKKLHELKELYGKAFAEGLTCPTEKTGHWCDCLEWVLEEEEGK